MSRDVATQESEKSAMAFKVSKIVSPFSEINLLDDARLKGSLVKTSNTIVRV